MNLQKINTPFHFLIFGASGDLAKLKLFPALYELVFQKRFSRAFTITGFARSAMSQNDFHRLITESIRKKYGKKTNAAALRDLLAHCNYQQGQYDNPRDFKALGESLLQKHKGKIETLAYLATPPSVFKSIVEHLAGLRSVLGQEMKIILEKPFGEDEKSATELFHFISQYFSEDQVYLLDHYLGKTPVQSILPLRTRNTVLNVLLQGRQIANIQINALEEVGVGDRIGYFESVGILKDMIQSHLLQMLSLITMSLPIQQSPKAIKREKMHILSALRYGDKDCAIVLGQYKSYAKEKNVRPGSHTPTFAALRTHIDLAEWYEVPIYLRTGKRLNHRHAYIVVEFKKPAFNRDKALAANQLVIELAPEENIQIHLLDAWGNRMQTHREAISAESLACTGDDCLPEHGRLILDVFRGDHTFFVSFEEIIASWQFIDRVVRRIIKDKIKVHPYADYSQGPDAQNALTACDGFQWYDADHL